ncbi:hypothetical protein KCP75_08770 [Salmonella enterica subsp. enterica]|nr:hypothetical protein KCP75_08770 [Salmonella enterica subsp. enterica]
MIRLSIPSHRALPRYALSDESGKLDDDLPEAKGAVHIVVTIRMLPLTLSRSDFRCRRYAHHLRVPRTRYRPCSAPDGSLRQLPTRHTQRQITIGISHPRLKI